MNAEDSQLEDSQDDATDAGGDFDEDAADATLVEAAPAGAQTDEPHPEAEPALAGEERKS
jgi:hypothetical protein